MGMGSLTEEVVEGSEGLVFMSIPRNDTVVCQRTESDKKVWDVKGAKIQ